MKKKYIVVLEGEIPPKLYLGEEIAGCKIIELKSEDLPRRVDVAWLLERYPLSRKSLIDHLRIFNKGNDGKHLYDPNEVLPILDNLYFLKERTNSRRKN
ncbi:hypothetical protein [Acinetobacter courvalinii]|uniref:hypothetical protein n=1 Tax=Acinetobacter courvalinii TaxID=280147 RepID=UPI0021D31EBC|nr:hypothetical protein [Acinetobacter courvalinii]MCU4639388.1 hypothetical protein [Acinetobacter courvalinii]